MSGAELTANLLDLSPDTMWLDPAEDTWTPDRIPSDAELVGYAMQSLARQPLAAAKAVRRTAEAALNVRRRNREPEHQPAARALQRAEHVDQHRRSRRTASSRSRR